MGMGMGMGDLDDSVRQVLSGDLDCYAAIVDACEARVRALVAAMIPDPDMVPDVTQDVFIVAYRRLSSFRPGTNFRAWLHAIARNVARNERRRWYRRRDMERSSAAEIARSIEDNVDRLIDALPDDVLASLHDCVDRLGGKTKRLVDGFYYKESPVRDLAALLGVSATAARVALHRARLALGRCLRQKGGCDV